MSTPVNGTNVMLYYHDVDTDTDIPFACGKSSYFDVTVNMVNVTSYTSAFFLQQKPDLKSWEMGIVGLVILNNYSYLYISDLILSKNTILAKYVIDNSDDGLVIYSGSCMPSKFRIDGNYNEAAIYTTVLSGTGAFSSTGTSVTPVGILVQGGVPTRFEGTSASESTSIVIASTISASTILEFNRGGSNTTQIIYAGTPTGQQIKFDTTTGTFSTATDNPFAAGEEVSGDFV